MSVSEREVKRTAPAVESTATQPARPARARRLPYWIPISVLALAVLLGGLLWWIWPPTLHGVVLQSPRPTADFTLDTSAGTPMSLSDFRGKYVLVYFGYTYCPDVCPITLNDLRDLADELGEPAMQDVQVLFISVDPQRDTPEQLATYLPSFHDDFLGMTGTVEQIQPVASQFAIFFEAQGGPDDAGYLVDHSSAVTLVDPQGRMRMVFPYGVSGAEMAADLQYFMRRSLRFW
ncbi:MAG: SCO family protein [Litorilinea sp.]